LRQELAAHSTQGNDNLFPDGALYGVHGALTLGVPHLQERNALACAELGRGLAIEPWPAR